MPADYKTQYGSSGFPAIEPDFFHLFLSVICVSEKPGFPYLENKSPMNRIFIPGAKIKISLVA
ncbi:MAG: hypothetical protein IPH20_16735 [Bacteroidales bacterium]|nr:hypothetical protein [Bacteroidales bacterium]